MGFPSHPKTRKTKNPKSKLQNPYQKASKRVCPTRVCPTSVTCVCLTSVTCVCPTSVSARPSAQQLRPERLKQFETPLTIHFVALFAQFFPVIKAAVFYMEFWFMTGLPQESRLFLFLQIHQHSEQNVKLEITQKLCKVWLIIVSFPKNLEQQKMNGKNFARVPPRGLFPLW